MLARSSTRLEHGGARISGSNSNLLWAALGRADQKQPQGLSATCARPDVGAAARCAEVKLRHGRASVRGPERLSTTVRFPFALRYRRARQKLAFPFALRYRRAGLRYRSLGVVGQGFDTSARTGAGLGFDTSARTGAGLGFDTSARTGSLRTLSLVSCVAGRATRGGALGSDEMSELARAAATRRHAHYMPLADNNFAAVCS
jgi:hypothetical protein